MTQAQHRLFIFLDEWLGIALLTYLYRAGDAAFWPVLILWAVMVYGLSYPPYWRRWKKGE